MRRCRHTAERRLLQAAGDYDLETIIKLLEDAGYESVELRTGHKHGVEPSLGPAERAKVRKRFERSKVKLADLDVRMDYGRRPPGSCRRAESTSRAVVQRIPG